VVAVGVSTVGGCVGICALCSWPEASMDGDGPETGWKAGDHDESLLLVFGC